MQVFESSQLAAIRQGLHAVVRPQLRGLGVVYARGHRWTLPSILGGQLRSLERRLRAYSSEVMNGPVENAIWFLLPAMASNLALYLLGSLLGKEVGPPLDMGLSWKGRRLLGDSRGFIGLPVVLTVGALVGLCQGSPEVGLVLGLGVELGTVAHSFVKRRLGLRAGEGHLPWDHLDYCLGAVFAHGFCFGFDWSMVVFCLAVGGLIHWLASLALRPHWDPR